MKLCCALKGEGGVEGGGEKKTSGIIEVETHKNYTPISFLMDRKAKWIEHLAAYERVVARDRDTARSQKKLCLCVCCVYVCVCVR